MANRTDLITMDDVSTLCGAFRERLTRSPDAVAYLQFDRAAKQWREYTWAQTAADVARYQAALTGENLGPGDRVAIMMQNRREWVLFDQAALGLGLAVVPVYTNDSAENVGYILENAGARLLFIENDEQWREMQKVQPALDALQRVVILTPAAGAEMPANTRSAADWLPEGEHELQAKDGEPDALCTIVYTSGTTGRPKGVMLSHTNILFNAAGGTRIIDVFPEDRFLSFLPLSHMLERSIGYYLPILAGSQVAYARSIQELADDLQVMKPTIMISVPRIFERVYRAIRSKLDSGPKLQRKLFDMTVSAGWNHFEKQQGRGDKGGGLLRPVLDKVVAGKIRERFGGRLRFAVCGGAALSPELARVFIGLRIPLQQGYGLTETSPVIAANPLEDNIPTSVGVPLPEVETKIGESDELLTRSPSVMLGYWNNEEATNQILEPDGWLHTGDRAKIENGHVFIIGRLKEIIVLDNGEKVPPDDMEMAISRDPLFEQVMVLGEGKPYLSALVVLNGGILDGLLQELGVSAAGPESFNDQQVKKAIVDRVAKQISHFPGYAKIRRVAVSPDPWNIENGLMTPTLKLKRARVMDACKTLTESLYEGH